MVMDNQLDQYFQFVKDMLLEEVNTHPFCILRQPNLAYHDSNFGQRNATMYMTINLDTLLVCTICMSLATSSLLSQSRSHNAYGFSTSNHVSLSIWKNITVVLFI